MFKLSIQVKIISICLLSLMGLFLMNNKKLYAFPGINLDVRKHQLEEEINTLIIRLNDVFNDMNLDSLARLNMMVEITNIMESKTNDLRTLNQQIIMRDQYNLQSRNNQNRQNNN
ncbi:MAG: effector protein ['Bonamia sp.' little leaf phytoplasma]|nr:effector protein ['Bonamia sp.' little leaf phytoplasma]